MISRSWSLIMLLVTFSGTFHIVGMIITPIQLLQLSATNLARTRFVHLCPADEESMKNLGLIPLFRQEQYEIDVELAKTLTAQELKSIKPSQFLECKKFNELENSFDAVNVSSDNAPAVITLQNDETGHKIDLIQCFTLNQFELAKKTSLSSALCGGHALFNAHCAQEYAIKGEVRCLQNMHSIEAATNYLLDFESQQWAPLSRLKTDIEKMKDLNLLRRKNDCITVVSSLELFDPALEAAPYFPFFIGPNEYAYVQEKRKKIMEGLKKGNFVHTIIFGNEEMLLAGNGHWVAVTVLKYGRNMQFIVTDTVPNVYHLDKESHEGKRLRVLIDCLTVGKSDSVITNIKAAKIAEMMG
jgi:hypothetical protein